MPHQLVASPTVFFQFQMVSTNNFQNKSAHLSGFYKKEIFVLFFSDANSRRFSQNLEQSSEFTNARLYTKVPAYIPWRLNLTYTYVINGNSYTFHNVYPHYVVSTPQLVTQAVKEFYKIPNGMVVDNPGATQCVAEFEQQYYSPSDLQLFFSYMGLDDYTSKVTLIGPNPSTEPGTEGNLDIQWIMGMAPGAATTYWSNAANSTIEIDHILTWQYAIGNMTNRKYQIHYNPPKHRTQCKKKAPLVSSVSYAMTESTANFYLGAGYVERSNQQFQVLANM